MQAHPKHQEYHADFGQLHGDFHVGRRPGGVTAAKDARAQKANQGRIEMLDDFANISGKDAPNLIMEKVASMSCKAAVKGNNHLSRPEIEALIEELLELDNPYNCPHGRPTIISMTKYEIEKKFRRIV